MSTTKHSLDVSEELRIQQNRSEGSCFSKTFMLEANMADYADAPDPTWLYSKLSTN